MSIDDGQSLDQADLPPGRDLLGNVCFYSHFAVMLFIVSGWVWPWRATLLVYAVFLPLVFVQWRFNRNSCVLNNLESLIRTGRWRNPANREEGAWLATLARDVIGWSLSKPQVDALTYGVMAFLWLVGLSHLFWW